MGELWSEPQPHPPLSSDAIHVWRVSLDRNAAAQEALALLLSADESARAARFHFERDRRHYVAARGVLRTLIGRYLAIAPRDVAFSYGQHGKPALAGAEAPQLSFNLSHTRGLALIAFGWERAIGVDVEWIRPLTDAAQIAQRFFSAWEVVEFTAVSDEQKPQAFFNCWTRKEAFIKAIGDGLSYPLDAFDVSLKPGEPARLWRIRGSAQDAAHWTLHAVTPQPGYVGAVIAEGRDWKVARFGWPESPP